MTHKLAIITGASDGLGRATAIGLATTGRYRVALIARRQAQLEEVQAACGGASVASVHVADCTDRAAVDGAIRDILAHWEQQQGGYSSIVLVNNVGRGCAVQPSVLTTETIDDMMKVNVYPAVFATQAILPVMKAAGRGKIFFNSSVVSRIVPSTVNGAGRSAYAMAKAALNMFIETLRIELALEGSPIILSLINMGFIATMFGLNAGGVDSRTVPGAIPEAEAAAKMIRQIELDVPTDEYLPERDYQRVVDFFTSRGRPGDLHRAEAVARAGAGAAAAADDAAATQ